MCGAGEEEEVRVIIYISSKIEDERGIAQVTVKGGLLEWRYVLCMFYVGGIYCPIRTERRRENSTWLHRFSGVVCEDGKGGCRRDHNCIIVMLDGDIAGHAKTCKLARPLYDHTHKTADPSGRSNLLKTTDCIRQARWLWRAVQMIVNSQGTPILSMLLIAHPRKSFRSTPSPRHGEALDQLEVFGPVNFVFLARMHGNIIGF